MTCEKVAVDAAIDSPDATPAGCYGASVVTVCPDAPITGQTQITINVPTTINTSTSTMCVPYHLPNGTPDTSVCLIAAKSVTVGVAGRINAIGTKPLVLLATSSMTITGIIDAASHINGTSGPAADSPACVAGTLPINDEGGPGGSFGSIGGAGGAVAAGAVPAGATTSAMTLRGGCPGRAGSGSNAGTFGSGGGAIALIAASISITGTINASGAAGHGAGLSAGGGGGGSGGMIALDAPAIMVTTTARIFANGGGGGEGGGGSNAGKDGIDSTAPTTIGVGGAGSAGAGGDGGDGFGAGMAAVVGGTGNDSGGGGGGGAGVIRVFPSQMLDGSISPPPS
jgi:hypothetical protein